jgi:integrase
MPWHRKSKNKPNTVRKRLADGTIRTYTYVRRSNAAPTPHAADSIVALIAAWQRSPEWDRLSDKRKSVCEIYLRPFKPIGHKPAKWLRRRDIREMRDLAYQGRPGAANGFVNVVSAMMAWAVKADRIDFNPARGIPPYPSGHLPAWTQAQADQAIEELPEHLRRLVLMALYTGQRRGDLCRLAWSNYDGARIRLTQGKTKTPLVIPAHATLKVAMDTWPRVATTILVNSQGRPWQPDNVSAGLKYALEKLGFPAGWNVHGLRKLAATNLAEAGCSAHEIAAITGHKSLAQISLYTAGADQERMATAAIVRLQTVRKPA